jgi:hypothetical protein
MKGYLTLIAGLVGAVQLQAVTFTPNDADLGDLDHHYAYSWGINWTLPSDQKIVSAEIKFKQIYDWKVETDNLYIHLLDKARTGVDSWLENPNDNVYADFFNSPTVNLNASGIGQGSQYSSVSQIKIDQWSDPQGADWRGTHAKDVTIAFDASEIAKLTEYIKNDNRFALGFDPDCHYYNQGVSFVIKTAKVPDGGATAVLLGLAMAGMAAVRRSRSEVK